MIHEILLSLAGGPSPLLHPVLKNPNDNSGHLQTLLSPAEQVLVESLVRDLGQRHKNTRTLASTISESHPSSVCRAVASAIITTHLSRFRRKILEVEKDVLENSPSIVGAYNIVPLSAIVGAFDGWGRKLEWLWDLVQFIQPEEGTRVSHADQSGRPSCTAAVLIAYLRNATHTGYQDIEEISLDLVKVAETAWLKQLSAWVLYGRHPANGPSDFFVVENATMGDRVSSFDVYDIEESLIPPFVTKPVAQSILFIGKSLNHIRERQPMTTISSTGTFAPELSLLPGHLAHLSALQYPLNPSSFAAAIRAIRLSLSQNALQKLLPISKVLEILHIFRNFFLLERGEFTIALLTAADERFSSRSKGSSSKHSLSTDLASMIVKEGEVSAVLARTWTAMASLQSLDDEDVDEELDQARELIHLSIKRLDSDLLESRDIKLGPITASFDDVLLPTSTTLGLRVLSPLDLFLTQSDVEKYSQMHAYLLAIRRAHLHLSKLYLLSVLRRNHPSPKVKAPQDHRDAFRAVAQTRAGAGEQTTALRPIWASISSAAFFLAELGGYFQGEVIQSSWSTFHTWLIPNLKVDAGSVETTLLSSTDSTGRGQDSRPTSSRSALHTKTHSPYDPETLIQAHRCYLERLGTELLLDSTDFTQSLRRLMTSIDHLSALMQRFAIVQQDLGPKVDHLAAESIRVLEDLKISSSKVAAEVRSLIEALRTIDAARVDGRQYKPTAVTMEHEEFVPWSGGALDRLLLKFDYGNVDKF